MSNELLNHWNSDGSSWRDGLERRRRWRGIGDRETPFNCRFSVTRYLHNGRPPSQPLLFSSFLPLFFHPPSLLPYRGKCCVTLLNETEALKSYLDREVSPSPPRPDDIILLLWTMISCVWITGLSVAVHTHACVCMCERKSWELRDSCFQMNNSACWPSTFFSHTVMRRWETSGGKSARTQTRVLWWAGLFWTQIQFIYFFYLKKQKKR